MSKINFTENWSILNLRGHINKVILIFYHLRQKPVKGEQKVSLHLTRRVKTLLSRSQNNKVVIKLSN
jgi:hypothetical protein